MDLRGTGPRTYGMCIGIMLLVFVFSGSAGRANATQEVVRHDLSVRLYPLEGRIAGEDGITVPKGWPSRSEFVLHGGFRLSSLTEGATVERTGSQKGALPVDSYTVTLAPGVASFRLAFEGTISHPVEPTGSGTAKGQRSTPGIISGEGVVLSGSSFWHPVFSKGFVTFSLDVSLPKGWDAVSQGRRSFHRKSEAATIVRWDSPEPQEEIHLIAAPFHEYGDKMAHGEAMVFLRSEDRELAKPYLEATGRYLSMYDRLIGPYPYEKFALVENFWETGYGMPSFTLLGPKIIRFPFIINSSYPHEILHNWWGNSVFPDYEQGNWSEGLTAYLSDHLIKEQQGSGAEYRRTTLQKYADYVIGGRDFPLTDFRSRHSSSSEAVGYGKALMFFHMLRQELGDRVFASGLQVFYRAKKFTVAGFGDLQRAFEAAAKRDLTHFFDQWVKRTGAPELKVSDVSTSGEKEGFVLKGTLEQVQKGEVYSLRVPVAITLEGRPESYQESVVMQGRKTPFSFRLPARPVRMDLDPEFDLFRRLDRKEIPPALSQVFGAEKLLVLLPSSAPQPLQEAYKGLARAIADASSGGAEIRLDREIAHFPRGHVVVILGWQNRYSATAGRALGIHGISFLPDSVRIGSREIGKSGSSFIFAMRSPANADLALAFIASSDPEAFEGLGRKLPHYHKYSYLVFSGKEPVNTLKEMWPVADSPMAVLPGGKQVPMSGLARRLPLIGGASER